MNRRDLMKAAAIPALVIPPFSIPSLQESGIVRPSGLEGVLTQTHDALTVFEFRAPKDHPLSLAVVKRVVGLNETSSNPSRISDDLVGAAFEDLQIIPFTHKRDWHVPGWGIIEIRVSGDHLYAKLEGWPV